MSVTRLGRIGLLFLLGLGLVLLLPVAPAQADAGHVVISEVYTRGGESGALYNADYAELYNPTPDAVDLNGWSLQGAGSPFPIGSLWASLAGVVLAPGEHLLVASSPGTYGEPLPVPPDIVSEFDFADWGAMGDGCVALVSSDSDVFSFFDPSNPDIVDRVAWCVEGSPLGAPNRGEGGLDVTEPDATHALLRTPEGRDTDANIDDFVAGVPAPRNQSGDVNVAAASFAGMVTAAGGTPIAGALVTVLRREAGDAWAQLLSTRTGGQGAYQVSGLAAGDYRVSFVASGLVPQYWDGRLASGDADTLTLAAGEERTGVGAVLTAAGQISGAASVDWAYYFAVPLDDGAVTVSAERQTATGWETAAEQGTGSLLLDWSGTGPAYSGDYVFELPPGTYRVRFAAPGYETQYWDAQSSAEAADLITLAAGETRDGIDAALVPPTGTVSGTLTRAADGGPLAGATVRFLPRGETAPVTVTTAGDGSYAAVLPPGDYAVWFGAAGYAALYWDGRPAYTDADTLTLAEGETRSGIDAALPLAGRLSGAVSAAAGGALAGARITLYVRSAAGTWEVRDSTSSASDGSWSLPAPPGELTLRFSADGYGTLFWDGRGSAATADAIILAAGETRDGIDAALPFTGVLISGSVTDAVSGEPLAGAFVYAVADQGEGDAHAGTVSAADGSYRLMLLEPGSNRIGFRLEGYDDQYYDHVASLGAATSLTLAAGESRAGIDAALERPFGTVAGRIYDEHHDGLPGATVTLTPISGGTPLVTQTDAQGYYEIAARPGDYRLRAAADGCVTLWWREAATPELADTLSVASGETTSAVLELRALQSRVSGTVTIDSAAGGALAGAQITLYARSAAGTWEERISTWSASDGSWSLPAPPGELTLRFSADGYGTLFWDGKVSAATADAIILAAGETRDGIDAALAQPGQISGAASVDWAYYFAVPLDDGAVTVSAERQTATGWETAAEQGTGSLLLDWSGTGPAYSGDYVFELPPGTYRVRFAAPGYETQYWDAQSSAEAADLITLAAGETRDGIDAALVPPTGTVSGTLTRAADGGPLAGATVRFLPRGETAPVTVTTAGDGSYAAVLPPGDYAVWFGAAGYAALYWDGRPAYTDADTLTLAEGETRSGIDAALPLAGRLSGAVSAAAGGALAGARITLYVRSAAGTWEVRDSTSSASDGSWSLPAPPGELTLRFSADGYGTLFWDGRGSAATADAIILAAGETRDGIDAALPFTGVLISGSVTDAVSGEPLAGAFVYAVADQGEGDAHAGTVSAADGSYRLMLLEPGSNRIGFRLEGYDDQYYDHVASLGAATSLTLAAGESRAGIDAALEQTRGTVAGTISGEGPYVEGMPDASVTLAPLDGGASVQTSTDGDGRYRIEARPGAYRLRAAAAGYVALWWPEETTLEAAGTVLVASGETAVADLALLSEMSRLSGTITVDSVDHALLVADHAYVRIILERESSAGWSIANQRAFSADSMVADGAGDQFRRAYAFPYLPPDTYRVRFEAGDLQIQYWQDETDDGAADLITLLAGVPRGGVDAHLRPPVPARVSGTVTDLDDSTPLAGATVRFVPADGSGAGVAAVTTDEGAYEAFLPPAEYTVCFSAGDHVDQYWEGKAALADADTLPVRAGEQRAGVDAALALQSAEICGSVSLHIEGFPYDVLELGNDAITVTAERLTAMGWRPASEVRTGWLNWHMGSYYWGDYSLTGLAPGTYRVRFEAPEHRTQYWAGQDSSEGADTITLAPGDRLTDIDADLYCPTYSLTGTVTGAINGAPLVGVWVEVLKEWAPGEWSMAASRQTTSGGYYSIQSLPPGDYRVRFSAAGYRTQYWDGKATLATADTLTLTLAGGVSRSVSVTMAPAAGLSGTVTGLHGEPLEGIEVRAWSRMIDPANTEIADGQDNDGDGLVDEGLDLIPYAQRSVLTDADGHYDTGNLDFAAWLEAVVLDGVWQVLDAGVWLSFSAPGYHELESPALHEPGTYDVAMAANRAPSADHLVLSTVEDTPLTVTLTASDPDDDPLTYAVGDPAHGTLGGTAPHLAYAPEADYTGPDSFTYTANDGELDSEPATVSITVVAANLSTVSGTIYAPGYGYTTPWLDGTLTASFERETPSGWEPPLDVSTGRCTWVDDGGSGYWVVDTSYSIDLPPGTYRVRFEAPGYQTQYWEGEVAAESADLLTLAGGYDRDGIDAHLVFGEPLNSPPVAAADSYYAEEDGQLVVAPLGVLANDSDPDGDALTAVKTSDPAHGTLDLDPDGGFTYTPEAGYSGPDSFTYTASDGELVSELATVSVTMAPAAGLSGTVTGLHGEPLEGIEVRAWSRMIDPANTEIADGQDNDGDGLVDEGLDLIPYAQRSVLTDADGHYDTGNLDFAAWLEAVVLDGVWQVLDAGVWLSFSAPGYHELESPALHEPGTYDVAMAANRAPSADHLVLSTVEDTPLTVTLTASDPDDDPLTYAVGDPAHGTLGGTAPHLAYAPEADYTGPDSFTYTANDGELDSEPATVSITVVAANDPPIADAGGPYSIEGGQVLVLDGSGCQDPDGTAEEEGLTYAWDLNADGIVGDAEGATAQVAWSMLSSLAPAIPVNHAVDVTLCVTDAGGLQATATTQLTITDESPPEIKLPEGITAEATGPEGAAVTFTVSASDAVDGSVAASADPPSGSTFKLGETTVNVTTSDAAGNSATASFTVTVRDTTSPHLSAMPDDITLEATGPSGAVATWTLPTADDVIDGELTPTASHQPGDVFPLGETTVTYTAGDAHHNSATASFTVTVRDTTSPHLSAMPDDITLEATGPSGAVATWTPPTASDLVDGEVTPTADHDPGDVFPLGETIVTYTATDQAGNSATAGFTVTARDTKAPVFSDMPDDITLEATGPSGAVATWTAPTASDLVDGDVTLAADHDPGDVFPLGETTVTYTATDQAGNSATASFTVTVRDTTSPHLSAMPDDITLEATGPSGAVATWTAPTAGDLVDGAITPTSDHSPGDVFPLGETTVTYTASDAHLNSTTASFTVTVTKPADTTPPHTTSTITKPWYTGDVPVTLTAIDSGSGVKTVSYKLAGARNWTTKTPDAQGQVSFTIAGNGSGKLLFYATDAAGNVEPQQSVSFGIDRYAPVTLVDYGGAWTKRDVTLHFAAVDLGGSGLDHTEYSLDGGATWTAATSCAVTAEGQTSVRYRSVDKASNVEASHTVTVRIDKTAPLVAITTPADGATYLLNQSVKASWSASDALSGLRDVEATTANGAAIATSRVSKIDPRTGQPVGFTYTVTATDKAGNQATKTVTYFVTYRLPAAFLAPIGSAGTSLFKLGSTVTVAFQLVDANGANVSSAAATIAVSKLSATPTGTIQKPVVTTKPTSGTAFVYNALAKQYVYYLGSASLGAGDFKVTVTLDDGGQITGQFSVK